MARARRPLRRRRRRGRGPRAGTRQRLRGATREIATPRRSSKDAEVAEHRAEQDLTRVFADFANGTAAPGGGLAGWFGRRPEEASPGFTAGRAPVAVNYETGEVASLHALLSPSELKRLADQIGTTNLSSLEAHLLRESYLPAAGSRRYARERQRADPAMLHLDTRFLQDMVALSLATAIGGLVAAFLSAPHTLGYMLGLFGRAIVELLSVQDLVLAPLLALPTAVHELRSSSRPGGWMLAPPGYAGAPASCPRAAALPRARPLTRDREADARPDANASLRARAAPTPSPLRRLRCR
ncbi:hypothetical protein JL721_12571 [Aureococcus anophagefferens]|nr:hypothetical protein JL721_12571 [Aureococcus anophagefferens]